MSVEGFWLMRTTQHDSSEFTGPGVIVLDTGKLFGGDSAYYYNGNYSVEAGNMTGEVRVKTHTDYDGLINVFGMVGVVNHVVFYDGAYDGNIIRGTMRTSRDGYPSLQFVMEKLDNFPS